MLYDVRGILPQIEINQVKSKFTTNKSMNNLGAVVILA
jgi:hypothetical protein